MKPMSFVKVFSLIVLAIMAIMLVSSLLFKPEMVYALKKKNAWGQSFSNVQTGVSVCMCGGNECFPCYEWPEVPEQ